MSKILDASCSAVGVVTAQGVTVTEAEVLSEGTKASTGLLFLDDSRARYIPSNATDIKDLIESLVAIIDSISGIATALDAVTVAPGSASALITQLGVLKTQLDLTKDTIK